MNEREIIEAKMERMSKSLKKLEGKAVRIGEGFEQYFDLIYYHPSTNRYIHMNPVKAGMVSKPVDYKYSSYSSYLSGKTNPILCTSKTLKYFRDSDTSLYQKFVEDAFSHQESEKAIQSNLGENELWLPW